MDPLTAFQAGASIITFVKFGLRLVTDTTALYKSPEGYMQPVVELSDLSSELKQTRVRIEQIASEYPLNETEEPLLQRCKRCVEIGQEFQATIDSITRRGTSRWNCAKTSFIVAAKGLWDTDKVSKLKEELLLIRNLIMIDIMVSLWRESKENSQFQTETKYKLDKISDALDLSGKDLVDEIKPLRYPAKESHRELSTEDQEVKVEWNRRTGFVEQIWSSDWQLGLRESDLVSASRDPKLEEIIIESLRFESMDDRSTKIIEAHKATYQWIFQKNHAVEDINGQDFSFPTWLESQDNKLYWITGKAGSGKSTLMKYILNHPTLERHLQGWAGESKPVWAGYYFWEAGSNPLQKSQIGMLRTLLYSCLRRLPGLVRAVCPRRWLLYSVIGHHLFDPPQWGWEELSRSLEILASEKGRNFRLAFFIDGLDEFEGDPNELIALIRKLKLDYKVKICVASRPWNEFRDAFSQDPSLKMQTLTKGDMHIFVRDRFDNFLPFQERRAVSSEASQKLIDSILNKAHGVFLWVTLVVRTLRASMAEGKTMADLQKILKDLPEDMMPLYTKIWFSIPPSHRQKASRYFQLKAAAEDIFPLDARFLWALDEEPIPKGNNATVLRIIRPILERRLDSYTRGVLELSPSGHIEYMHRTASEWIQTPETWKEIRSRTLPEFDASLALFDVITDIFSGDLDYFEEKDIYPSISRALLVASNVADRAETSPRLVKSLDRFNFAISRSHNPIEYRLTPWLTTFREHEVIHPAINRTIYRRKLRSLVNVFQSGKLTDSCNSFVGLAAQFGVLAYVREKISHRPELIRKASQVRQSGHMSPMSLMENAIWGILAPLIGRPDGKPIILKPGSHVEFYVSEDHQLPEFDQRHRLGLIKLLLHAGYLPNQSILSPTSDNIIKDHLALTIAALGEGKSLCNRSDIACITLKSPCNLNLLHCDETGRARLELYFQTVEDILK